MNTHTTKQFGHSLRGSACLVAMAALILSCATSPAMAQAESESESELPPTDVLRKEHTIIQKMANAAKQDAEKIQSSGAVDADRIAKYYDFFKNFADRCHHAKEEDELFPVLREMKVDPVIIDLLILHHAEGRILLAGIEDALIARANDRTKPDTQALGRYILEYAQLMDRHIRIENEYLWPRAAEQLSDLQKDALAKAFHRIETVDLGQGFHEKYHALAMDILGKEDSR